MIAPTKRGNPFKFTLSELSGSLADLGVMLPLVLALISLNGVDATAAFVGIGLTYLLVALVYRLPIPVQPLKSVSGVALALGLPPVAIVTGAIWNAAAFLTIGTLGLERWVQKAFPKPVVRGIQLGLAWLLINSAWKLISVTPKGWEGGLTLSRNTVSWLWVLVVGAAIFLFIFLLARHNLAALGSNFLWGWNFKFPSGTPPAFTASDFSQVPASYPQLGAGLAGINSTGITSNPAQLGKLCLCHCGCR